jgi:hypothetical protein
MDNTFSANGKQNLPSFKNSDYEPKIQTNEKIAYTGFLAVTRGRVLARGKDAMQGILVQSKGIVSLSWIASK